MHFLSCFLWSIFLVVGFPLAVRKEENSKALRQPHEALFVRDDTAASEDFSIPPSTSWTTGGGYSVNLGLSDETQQLSTNGQPPSILALADDGNAGNILKQPPPIEAQDASTDNQTPSISSPGFSILAPANDATAGQLSPDKSKVPNLLAQNVYNEGGGGGALDILLIPIGGAGLLLEQIENINHVFQDDHPKVKVTGVPFMGKEPSAQQGRTHSGAGATTNPAAATEHADTDSDDLCPSKFYGTRKLSWCDLGDKQSIAPVRGFSRGEYTIDIHGLPCTLFL